MFIRIFPLTDIPTDSEKATTDYLYKIYQDQVSHLFHDSSLIDLI